MIVTGALQITNRRTVLKLGGLAALAGGIPPLAQAAAQTGAGSAPGERADYTMRIGTGLVELAPDRILSTTTCNGQFPGPLLRFKEGQRVVVEIHNETDTPEQLHWHGQVVPVDVDRAAEEGTPYIPARGMRRIAFTPAPAGFASITRICAPAATCSRASTTARLARCTSSRNGSRAPTTAKCSWSSRSSSRIRLAPDGAVPQPSLLEGAWGRLPTSSWARATRSTLRRATATGGGCQIPGTIASSAWGCERNARRRHGTR